MLPTHPSAMALSKTKPNKKDKNNSSRAKGSTVTAAAAKKATTLAIEKSDKIEDALLMQEIEALGGSADDIELLRGIEDDSDVESESALETTMTGQGDGVSVPMVARAESYSTRSRLRGQLARVLALNSSFSLSFCFFFT